MNNNAKIFSQLSWLTQLGISLVAPPLLCILFVQWGIERWAWPEWTMFLAFFFGLGGTGASFYKFYSQTRKKADHETKKAPPAFNGR